MSKEIKASIKEFSRTFLMGFIPILILSVTQSIQVGEWTINVFFLQATIILAFLSAIDKWLHKSKLGINKNGIGF